eukprot:15347470-Ditylum_brightwellii.AAC.2
MREYATKSDVDIIKGGLKSFDPGYYEIYCTKSKLHHMPFIDELLKSPAHCKSADYTFELCLCGITGCTICSRIGRKVHTPNVEVGTYNLHNEVLHWLDLPVPNQSYPDHFLSPANAREYIVSKNFSFEKLKKWIPNAKVDTEENTPIKKAKQIDREHAFKVTKLRLTVDCDQCGALRGIYSNNVVGAANGPSKEDITFLELKLENEYICGSALTFDAHGKFFVKRQLCCGDFIEY